MQRAAPSPGRAYRRGPDGPLDAALVLQLQRTAGNRAASSLVLQRLVEVPPPPVAPTPADPHADPGFQQVKGKISSHARATKKHPSASAEVKKAHEAAVPPANDKEAQAKTDQAAKMNAAKPGEFDRAGFIAAVKKAIDAAAPKTLEDADSFGKSGKAGEIKGQVLGQVNAGKTAATGDIKQTTAQAPDESKAKEKPVTPLAADPATPAAPDPGAAKAMPGPAPAEQTNLGNGPAETTNAMASAGVTEQQLAESNEPEFQGALAAKKQGEEHSQKAPTEVRAEEKAMLGAAQGQAAGAAKATVAAMTATKSGSTTKAAAEKQASKARDEAAQKDFAAKVDGIFNAAKTETEAILKGIDEKVNTTFASGEGEARAAFEAKHKADMKAYTDERYSGVSGAALWLKDKLISPPPKVNQIFEDAKKLYVAKMEDVIGKVADVVGAELTRARERIAQGRKAIDAEVAAAPKNIKQFALEKQQSIGAQFDQLEQDVDAKQAAVVEDLAQKYVEARNAVDEKVKAMQEENKGLWDKAKDAVGGVIETIKKLKDMLLGVLAKAAGAIDKIISKPIEFLGNLVNAVKTGLNNFVGNIAEHLKGALQEWLLGSLASAGIELPKSFDVKGILHLIFQILGLTWTQIRARIVKGLGKAGEAIMTKIEQGVEVIRIIATEGLPGIWKKIVEKISDLKEQVIGKIKDFVITKIVIAGVTWLISLLNPASAFVKACKAIYDVVMFFVEKGEAIMEFVNTVLDSIGAIASGAISGAASAIEGVLKKTLPLILGFLASLLGLGGISDKIKEVLEAVQKPVNKVLDSVIATAVKYGKRMFGKGIAFVKKKAKQVKDWGKKQYEKGKAVAVRTAVKAKARIKEKPGGSGDATKQGKTEQERLAAGMSAAKRALAPFAGKTVDSVKVTKLLGGVKSTHGLATVEPTNQSGHWAIHVQTASATESTAAEVEDEASVAADISLATAARSQAVAEYNAVKHLSGVKKKTIGVASGQVLRSGRTDDRARFATMTTMFERGKDLEKHLSVEDQMKRERKRRRTGERPEQLPGDDLIRAGGMDAGIPGQWHAAHVEVQASALYPDAPVGVSREMCSRCQSFYVGLAKRRKKPLVVADPAGIKVFRRDGSIRSK